MIWRRICYNTKCLRQPVQFSIKKKYKTGSFEHFGDVYIKRIKESNPENIFFFRYFQYDLETAEQQELMSRDQQTIL